LLVFKVNHTVLMPRGQLHIMVPEDAYPGDISELTVGSLIGVVQPIPFGNELEPSLPVYQTGCAGRIADISTLDNDTVLEVFGMCRFNIESYSESSGMVAMATVSYDRYEADLSSSKMTVEDKERLLSALDKYFSLFNIFPNWKEIEQAPDDILVSALAMSCPFHPLEKQSLLEIPSISKMSEMMASMIEMETLNNYGNANTVN
jgi:Lon protease-like protein